MGAALIGYHLIFPKEEITLESAGIGAGAKLLKELRKSAKEVLEVLKDRESTDEEGDLSKTHPLLADWMSVFDCEDDEGIRAAMEDLLEFCGGCSRELVFNLIAPLMIGFWRDVNSICVKHEGKELVIVFTGDTSWGDEPEGGGYQQAKRVLASGLYAKVGGL